MSAASDTSQTDQQLPTTNGNNGTELSTTEPTGTLAPPPPPSQSFVRPLPSESFNPAAVFMEAYDCAKLNNNWNKVSSSLMIHPDWLTKIPEGRRWTMLHQIVFSGDVMHLNEVLVLQLNNPDFRLLCKTLDDKTVREVASARAHVHPQMLRRIERLVAVDQLLNNAKDRKWDSVKQCITLQPDIVNEKPPYRRFYLAHHLAFVGDLDMFKELRKNCQFKLDLLAESKTISQVAREHNHSEFAEYVETLTTTGNAGTENETDEHINSHPSSHLHFSPGFYENPGISIIPANLDLNNLFPTTTSASSYSSHHLYSHHDHHFQTHSLYHGHQPMILTTTMPTASAGQSTTEVEDQHTDGGQQSKSVQPKPKVPELTDEEQAEYEKTIIDNVQKMSQQNLLNSITCCITKTILRDPVVAADGFTYERQAILSWFEQSNRSPMTNQELDNLELKPNFAIKSILQLLQDTSSTSQLEKKSNANAGDHANAD